MADPTVAEVIAPKPVLTGGVSFADTGATLPTDATTALDPAFTALGYATDDGVVPTVDTSTDTKKAWGGDVIKVFQTDYSRTYEITFAQAINVDVLKLVFGDANVTSAAATAEAGNTITYKDKGAVRPHKSWVIDGMDGDVRVREVIEDGQVTQVEEGPWVDNDIRSYKATIQCFRGDTTDAFIVGYSDDGQKTEA